MTAAPSPEQLAALMVLAASASPEAVTEIEACPRCGGSAEVDPVSDYGEVTRVHRGLVACQQDGDDDNCDWAADASLVAAHTAEEERLAEVVAALRDALRTLCLQREGRFHTEAAWSAARELVGLELKERSW